MQPSDLLISIDDLSPSEWLKYASFANWYEWRKPKGDRRDAQRSVQAGILLKSGKTFEISEAAFGRLLIFDNSSF